MTGKALSRIRGDSRKATEAVTWARPRSVAIPNYCTETDSDLWHEAQQFGTELRARAAALGEQLGVELGGGARVELLYFLTRLHRPVTVLETGVLHGYSSAAFLAALQRNGDGGRLYSSDFPYFRERDPEALVGVLVPDDLRSDWTLKLEGDRANLPVLLQQCSRIDLFHYDSDKSYSGRRWATERVEPHLGDDAVTVMDDIQDNLYFRDWTRASGRSPVVLGTGSYFVGATGVTLPHR